VPKKDLYFKASMQHSPIRKGLLTGPVGAKSVKALGSKEKVIKFELRKGVMMA